MTDISVVSTGYQVENRSWLISAHGTDPGTNPSVVLDLSKFTAGTHFPNGFIPSGIALGKVTATGLYGPYDNTATDGRETAAGHLFSTLGVRTGQTKVGGALVVHGFIRESKLPFTIDTAGKTDLKSSIIYS
ncbi:head decoration protein [Rhodococcoides fascians]|uniref:head decoration protein n=1 Tax=Rhodococcoides fascians TaxID=1828 RepID=UPI00050C7654|nr:head decoration protein [Rhodococcus fascians]